MLLKNNQAVRMSSQNKKFKKFKKKPLTELPKLKHNKMLNTWDRANMKIIPT